MITPFLVITSGVLSGAVSGLIPGIHINTLAIILLGLMTKINIDERLKLMLIFSMATTHLFFDFLPSILLGVPNEQTAMMILPTHKLVLSGNGQEAINNSVTSAFITSIFIIISLPVEIILLKVLFPITKVLVLPVLLLIPALIIINSTSRNNGFWSWVIFILSGVLGILTLKLPFLNQPLLALFSGLFGTSLILESLMTEAKLPKQARIRESNMHFKNVLAGNLAGIITALFPSISSSQAVSVFKNHGDNDFIEKVASTEASNFIMTLLAAYALGKLRSGVMVVAEQIKTISSTDLSLIIITILISSSLSVILIFLSKNKVVSLFSKLNYFYTNLIVLSLLLIVTLIYCGIVGLFIMLIASAIGVLAQKLSVRKSICMGALMIPVILNQLQ